MSETEEEKRKRKEEERRAWLGEPIEHGGGYRPLSTLPARAAADLVPEAGCCALQAIGSATLLLGLLSFSTYSLLP